MTDLDKLIAAAAAVAEAMPPEERAAMLEAQRQSWARGEASLAETSASPPRVPVSSIDSAQQRGHLRRCPTCDGSGEQSAWGAKVVSWPCPECAGSGSVPVGVESGPGQPMDICTRLTNDAKRQDVMANGLLGAADTAKLEREAAAEIRRLRAQCDAERDYKAGLARLKEIKAEGYRAGIEAAAKHHDDQAAEWREHYAKNGNDPSAREYAKQHSADAAAVRALADAPKSEGG